MFIARVVGVTWATVKHKGLDGLKLLLVRQIDSISGKFFGKTMMAVDSRFGAGVGDTVLIVDEGSSARSILNNPDAPIRTIVAGIVDEVNVSGKRVKYH